MYWGILSSIRMWKLHDFQEGKRNLKRDLKKKTNLDHEQGNNKKGSINGVGFDHLQTAD